MITETCPYHGIARVVRDSESSAKEMFLDDFEGMGCYECEGNNRECKSYINPKEEYYKFHDIIKNKLKDCPYG